MLDEALDERSHLHEQGVRLLGGERAARHRPSIVGAVRRGQRDLGPPLEIFLWSRLAIWLAALASYLLFRTSLNPEADFHDSPRFHDVGWAVDVWARWDSGWFLQIAEDGYSHPSFTPAFFPLYPALVGAVGRVLGSHYVLAGTLVSLAACAAAFVLLYRLGRVLLDEAAARRAVLYLAIFPTAVFLGAVYSESLYLALTIGAFLAAERGRFGVAGLTGGLALLTRPVGVALLPALALLAWRSADRRGALLRLAAAPAAFLAYPLLLWADIGRPFEFLSAQEEGWQRSLSPLGPLGGLWDGARAGWAGARQLAAGADGTVYWDAATGDPLRVAAQNLEQLAFAALFVCLVVLAWKRLGAPYGLFAGLSLALPLSVPASDFPLLSIQRFGLAVFPFFLALATLGSRPRAHTLILATSALLLGVATARWALWHWVA
jgi:Mannosyltransferase (PIG-V)